MRHRLVGLLALFTLAAAPSAAWSASCTEVESLLAQGISVAAIEVIFAERGEDRALVAACVAQLRAAAESRARLEAAAQQQDDVSHRKQRVAEEREAGPPASVAAPVAHSPARKNSAARPAPQRSPAAVGRAGLVDSTRMAPPPPVAHPTGSEDYTDYGLNELVLTSKDALSTFSVDVDTASYAIARRKLTEGGLPPEAAVRVEEFVNAFPYAYTAPTDGSPFAVHLEATANPEEAGRHILRVGLQGKALTGARKPVRLTFLVDVSGSMHSEDKLGMARRALHHLVDNLGPEDMVSIATYAGSDRVVLEPTYTTRRSTIHDAIDSLTAGGGTAMGSGMELAYAMASKSYLHGVENRVIVLSDGDANIGRTSFEAIHATVKQYAEQGITLTTVGLGMGNYKDTMMEQLANKGDGNYFYIDSFNEAKKVFGTDLAGTIETIAKDVKIQVEFDPDAVHAYRLIGYENRDIADRDFRNDQVDAGEVGSGHQVTAVYDVLLKEGAQASESLATVRLRAKRPGPDSPAREYTTAVPVSALQPDWTEASPDLRMAWTVATFAEKLRGSPFAAEIRYADLHRHASQASRGTEAHRELLALIARAGSLSGEGAAPVATR